MSSQVPAGNDAGYGRGSTIWVNCRRQSIFAACDTLQISDTWQFTRIVGENDWDRERLPYLR